MRTLVRAGVVRPTRPDRAARALAGLARWGPTLAAGYIGAAALYPDAAAIIDELGTLSFDAVSRRSDALANELAGRGIRAGDGVAIMCRNHRGFIEASIACAKLGAHALYLNTAFAGPQVPEVVQRESPAALIYDQEFAPVVQAACAGRSCFVAWRDDPADAAHPALDDLIAGSPQTSPASPPAPGRTVILTSGTTGTPKGANRASPSSLEPAAALLSRIPLHAREPTMIAASGSALTGPLAARVMELLRADALQPVRLDRGGVGDDRHPGGSAQRAGNRRATAARHRGENPRH